MVLFAGGTSTAYMDNNDGVISVPEQAVRWVDTANETAVDYDYYVSFTLGGNYLINQQQSIFTASVEVVPQKQTEFYSLIELFRRR
jgi:hypothetical protein